MKKHFKRGNSSSRPQFEPDLAVLVSKIQQQIVSLEKKVDILIGRPSSSGPSRFSPSGRSRSNDRGRPSSSFRERSLVKAVCADCKQVCELPFKPRGSQPVYCRECYSKHNAKENYDRAPREKSFARGRHFKKQSFRRRRGSV